MTSHASIAPAPAAGASLLGLPIGARARILRINGGQLVSRRLLGLGLRVGSEVELVHHRGGGVVIASSGNRIALGGGVAEKILVEPLGASPAA